jgi:type I restriction enzyme S subunit
MRPYIRAANVTWAGLDLSDVKTMNFTDDEMAIYRMEPGDIVLSEASGSASEVGKPALWSGGIADCAFQNTLIRVRSRVHEPKFLLHYFRYQALVGRFAEHSRGVGIHHLGRSRLATWLTPIPPLDEQRRIVDLLEDHLSRLDAADAYVATNLQRAESWRSALVSRALWSDQYPRAGVGEVLREPMRNGRSDRAAKDSESGTKTLTLTAVTKNAFIDKYTKLTITTPERAAGLWLEPGDVFVQRSNTPDLVGTTARYDGPRGWAIFPDLLIRLRADDSKIDSRFLAVALRSEEGHTQLRRRAKGLAGSMPKIDQAAIASAVVPLPEPPEQQRLLLLVEQADQALEVLRAELDCTRQRVAALRQALLAAAFSGRLTGSASEVSEVEEMIDA